MKTIRSWEVVNDSTGNKIKNGGPFNTINKAWARRREFLKANKDIPSCNIYINRLEKIDGVWFGQAVN